jgi:hypothetical protein
VDFFLFSVGFLLLRRWLSASPVRGTQKRDKKCFTGRASIFFPLSFFLLRFWAFL